MKSARPCGALRALRGRAEEHVPRERRAELEANGEDAIVTASHAPDARFVFLTRRRGLRHLRPDRS